MSSKELFSLHEEEDEFQGGSSGDEERGRSDLFCSKPSESNSDSESGPRDDVASRPQKRSRADDADVLDQAEVENKLRDLKNSGVVYLSRIPPYMKPVKLRQILQRFGDVNRIFLNPEDPKAYAKRVKGGGNKKKMYTEGWAEFTRKSQAKLAAETLNGNKIGGKKGSFYYDDILNIKYLKKFKWTDLTEQIALEAQERQEKLKAEIALATRENKIFIENVERKAMLDKIETKKGKRDSTVNRNFTQRASIGDTKTKSRSKQTPSMDSLLSQVL